MTWWLWRIVAWLGVQLPAGLVVGSFLGMSNAPCSCRKGARCSVCMERDGLTRPQVAAEMSGGKSRG